MTITRGCETILKEINEKLETLNDQWERVQFKKRMSKRELFKTALKQSMDLILKVIKKLQWWRGTLVRVHELHGNSVERQSKRRDGESTH